MSDLRAGPWTLPIGRVANLHLTAQAAAIGSTILLTAPAAGLYRISFALTMTTGGGTGQLNFEVTANNGGASVSQDSALVNVATAGNSAQDSFTVEVGSGNVTYQVIGTGLTMGTSRFSLRVVMEQLSVL
jgi:hypothetical protein